jgi:hypothetical protein
VTSLSSSLLAGDRDELATEIERLRGGRSPEAYATSVNAGTAEDHIGRFRSLAEAGVQTAVVSLPNISPEAVERFAEVIAGFPAGDDGWPGF